MLVLYFISLNNNFLKNKENLGCSPKTKFKKLVKIMVEEDLNRWSRWLKGEYFPWDAFTSGRDSIVLKKNKNL